MRRRCADWLNLSVKGVTLMITLEAIIYVAMNGEFGCMPDSVGYYRTEKDAVDGLSELFELGRTRKAELRRYKFLRLKPEDGAAYCDINPMRVVFSCEGPMHHWNCSELEEEIPLGDTAELEELVDYLLEELNKR